VDVLAAVADLEVRAPALWKRWLADRPRDEQQGFVEAFRDRAPDLALAGEAHLAKLDEREAQRGQALALGAEGRLAEAVPLLAVLPPGDPELDSLRERVAVEQRRFTAPLAGALTSDGHEEEAWAALRAAGEEGWLEGVTLLLRAQARRHPADIRRAGWLARALVVAERWAEAERQFGAAAALEGGGPGQVERELEGVDLALDAGENARAARWLVRLVRTQRNRSLARGLAVRVWGGKIPHEVAEPLLAELRRDGSGLFAGAVRALQDASKR